MPLFLSTAQKSKSGQLIELNHSKRVSDFRAVSKKSFFSLFFTFFQLRNVSDAYSNRETGHCCLQHPT